MDGLENGWYLKSNGHMTCDSCYQRIGPFKACSALEHGNVITFVHVVNGSEMPCTRYMPVSEYESVVAENEKLRELVADIYAINYPWAVGIDNTCIASNRYDPCERCESEYGETPCDNMIDPYNKICKPIQGALLAERMRELGIEVSNA